MPVLAALDGQAVFGGAVLFDGPKLPPRRAQENTYPGVNGKERLDQGADGMVSVVAGRLSGPTLAALSANIALLWSFYDGQGHTLTDNMGNSFGNAVMVGFEYRGRGEPDPDLGYTIPYVCTFEHLTTS